MSGSYSGNFVDLSSNQTINGTKTINGSLVIGSSASYKRGSVQYYDQQSAPSLPNVGDLWTERDSSNNVVNQWWWNGTYWLTVVEHLQYLNNISYACTRFYITATNTTYFTLPFGSAQKVFLGSLTVLMGNVTTNDSSDYWSYSLTQNSTTLSSGSTSALGVAPVNILNTINTVLLLSNGVNSTPFLQLTVTKNGSPSIFDGSIYVKYRLVR